MKNPKLNRLRDERKKKKLNTTEVALYLGISQSMYSYIEIGRERLTYDIAVKLSKLFNLSPDELFYDDFKQFFTEETYN